MAKIIGTAGWNIPSAYAKKFPEEGSHLERYARVFKGTEINSSFYKEHLPRTYSRWASVVPSDFKFSVKLSKQFTHLCDLKPKMSDVKRSLSTIMNLEDKLGVILLQFPGSFLFDAKKAERFYKIIRKTYQGPMVLEARNESWVSKDSQSLMLEYGISKVIADPERCPGGSRKILTGSGLAYYRLHGRPVIYRSSYTRKFLNELNQDLSKLKNVWVVFDNTTLGFGTKNALDLAEKGVQHGRSILSHTS